MLWNMDMRFRLWNVRSMNSVGSLMTVSRELSKYKLDLVEMQEVRWEGGGRRIQIFLWKGELES
jgi:hypothetical protein